MKISSLFSNRHVLRKDNFLDVGRQLQISLRILNSPRPKAYDQKVALSISHDYEIYGESALGDLRPECGVLAISLY